MSSSRSLLGLLSHALVAYPRSTCWVLVWGLVAALTQWVW
jgi:hypothetical protein